MTFPLVARNLRRLVELHDVFFGAPDPDALLPLTDELRAVRAADQAVEL